MPYWANGIGASPDYLGGWGEIYLETVKTTGNFLAAGATACGGMSIDSGVYSLGVELCRGYGRSNYEWGMGDPNSYGISISLSAGIDTILKKTGAIGKLGKWIIKGKKGAIHATSKHLTRGKHAKLDLDSVTDKVGKDGSGLDFIHNYFHHKKGKTGDSPFGFELNLTWEYARPFTAWCTNGNKSKKAARAAAGK